MKNMFNVLFCKKKGCIKKYTLSVLGYIVLFLLVIITIFGILYSLDFFKHTNIVNHDILHINNFGLPRLTPSVRDTIGVPARPSLLENFASFTERPQDATQNGVKSSKKRIGIANMMKNPTDLPLWLKYHRNLGISKFFIRIEDSPSWEEYLKDLDDVYMEVGTSNDSGNNYTTVIDRQVTFVNKILRNKHFTQDIDWLIHIDSDELIHGDLNILFDLPNNIKTVKFVNAEAIFDEPTKRNTCFSATKFLRCDKGATCKSYVNGKAAGRTNDPTVYLAGCHDFGIENGSGENYSVPFDKLNVLHFESCSFGGWVEKYLHMSKGDKGDMPFNYYKESIVAAKNTHDIYKENKMPDPSQFDSGHLYKLNTPIKI